MAKTYLNIAIKDMAAGDEIEGFFILTSANVKTSTNGSPFLAGKLGDKDGEIDIKVWDYCSDLHEHIGAVCKVRGTVSVYNNVKQIVIDRIRLAQAGDTYNLGELVPTAPVDIDETAKQAIDMLNTIYDKDYREIALRVYDRMGDKLKTLPAGKSMHHAFLGGWLMHTTNMMRMAATAADVYGAMIDYDLLLCGTFCHDIAKRFEFTLSELGLVSEYSLRGQLLGHVFMGAQEIRDVAKEIGLPEDSEKVLLLQHMLLSHHGELENGSPVTPRIIEAEILSHLDMLDARVEAISEVLEKTERGTMSERVRATGNSVYYHN